MKKYFKSTIFLVNFIPGIILTIILMFSSVDKWWTIAFIACILNWVAVLHTAYQIKTKIVMPLYADSKQHLEALYAELYGYEDDLEFYRTSLLKNVDTADEIHDTKIIIENLNSEIAFLRETMSEQDLITVDNYQNSRWTPINSLIN